MFSHTRAHTQSLEHTHKNAAHKEPKREKGKAVKEKRNKMGHKKRQSATRTKRKMSLEILYKEHNKQMKHTSIILSVFLVFYFFYVKIGHHQKSVPFAN